MWVKLVRCAADQDQPNS